MITLTNHQLERKTNVRIKCVIAFPASDKFPTLHVTLSLNQYGMQSALVLNPENRLFKFGGVSIRRMMNKNGEEGRGWFYFHMGHSSGEALTPAQLLDYAGMTAGQLGVLLIECYHAAIAGRETVSPDLGRIPARGLFASFGSM